MGQGPGPQSQYGPRLVLDLALIRSGYSNNFNGQMFFPVVFILRKIGNFEQYVNWLSVVTVVPCIGLDLSPYTILFHSVKRPQSPQSREKAFNGIAFYGAVTGHMYRLPPSIPYLEIDVERPLKVLTLGEGRF
ncbi:hypothetical protein TNCV_1374821 [Trichonephila clavipes]|nr:hypothetical protein TNCV_1374821 [Trichonephila clavipes]